MKRAAKKSTGRKASSTAKKSVKPAAHKAAKQAAPKAGSRAVQKSATKPRSAARTIEDYLASLPEDRRKTIQALRVLVNRHLPKGYVEMSQYGVLSWAVPLEVYPDTYNKQAMTYVAIANQKNYISFHLMCVYGNTKLQQRLVEGFKAAGKRLDMGKACLRFRSLEELALDTITELIAAVPMRAYIDFAKAAQAKRRAGAK